MERELFIILSFMKFSDQFVYTPNPVYFSRVKFHVRRITTEITFLLPINETAA